MICRSTPHRPSRFARTPMTMVEIIAAMAILSVLLLLLAQFFHGTQIIWRTTNSRSRVYEEARLIFDVINRDLQSMVVDDQQGHQINYTIPAFTGHPSSEVDFAFISNSGVGTKSADYVPMIEVGYKYDSTEYTLTRRVTRMISDGGDWDFVNQTPSTWAGSGSWSGDDAVLGEGVHSITFDVFQSLDTLATETDSTTLPLYVRVNLALFDPALQGDATKMAEIDKHLDTFVKLIFVRRGD